MKNVWKLMWGLLVCMVCLSPNVFAEDDVVETGLTGSYTAGIFDKYLGEWSGTIFDRRPSVQGEVCIDLVRGFYTGVWFAKNIGDVRGELDGDEIDLYMGWEGRLLGFKIDSAVTYYDLAPVADGRKDNVWAPSVKVSKSYVIEGANVSPFVRVETPIPDTGSSFDGGIYLTTGTELLVPLGEFPMLGFSPYITYDNGVYDAKENVIYGQMTYLQFAQGDFTFTCPSFLLTVPLRDDPDRKFETCFGIALELGF